MKNRTNQQRQFKICKYSNFLKSFSTQNKYFSWSFSTKYSRPSERHVLYIWRGWHLQHESWWKIISGQTQMRLLNPLRSPETCDQSLANQMPWSAHLANQRWARLRRHLPPIKHSGMRGHLLFLTGWLPHFLSNIWRISFSNDRHPLPAQPGLVTGDHMTQN